MAQGRSARILTNKSQAQTDRLVKLVIAVTPRRDGGYHKNEKEVVMPKCIHQCGHYHGCDGCWYISCSVFDKDKPSEECNEHCEHYETDGGNE